MTLTVIALVEGVRPHGDNLSIVTVAGNEVVANRREDGSFRWAVGQPVVYVREGAIIPDDVLMARGYWNDDPDKPKGLLEGNRGNRVKMRRFAGFESRGLLFQVGSMGNDWTDDNNDPDVVGWVLREGQEPDTVYVKIGDDVADFLGITEHVAK